MSRTPVPSHDATMLLQRIAGGDPDASAALLQLLYDDLRRLAEAQMRGERAAHTLQATALVHEAWVRMVGPANEPASGWEGRAHFVGAFAEAMRRVLVDHARRRGRIKRGGGCRRVPLGALDLIGDPDPELIGALDDAISRLEAHDRELSQVVRLRFYAGLGTIETAQALGVSERTVKRHWAFARAWLAKELGMTDDDGAPDTPNP